MASTEKNVRYIRIISQLDDLIRDVKDPVARMATINALLYHKMQDFFWVGFYLLREGRLTAGPYQGPLACLVLEKDKGVCWTSIREQRVVLVADVDEFPGHIACDPRARSEIAVPIRDPAGRIIGVLDIDSRKKDCFDDEDEANLKTIVSRIH